MELTEIAAIPDPADRARAATAAIVDTRAELLAIRRAAIAEMRQTMSYGLIAKTLGVSRTRVVQMEKD